MNLDFRFIARLLPFFLLFESLSFLGYFWPSVNLFGFLLLTLACLFLAVYRFEYALLLVFAELLIGSKGYLFSFDLAGPEISIRIAFWLIVMIVWKGRFLLGWWRTGDKMKFAREELYAPFNRYFLALIIFAIWGVVNGIISGNGLANVFFDANAWLYLFLAWPLSKLFKDSGEGVVHKFMNVLAAASFWLVVKTWLTLFFFSHNLPILDAYYHWIRDTGVGEITAMNGGFYRVFIQSHIYSLFAFGFSLLFLLREIITKKISGFLKSKIYWQSLLSSSIFLSVILIGLSRSFWVGLIGGIAVLFGYLFLVSFKKYNFATAFNRLSLLFVSLVVSLFFSLIIIFLLVKFPWPSNSAVFDPTSVLTERATSADESAIGSRWALLPKLFEQIGIAPFFGKGFGATVTYISQDPRVLENNPSGQYTTYAFEWGWLDIWLKIGLLGALSWLSLIGSVLWSLRRFWGDFGAILSTGMVWGVGVLALVNIFTPYLNHPLGIGFILLVISMANISGKPLVKMGEL